MKKSLTFGSMLSTQVVRFNTVALHIHERISQAIFKAVEKVLHNQLKLFAEPYILGG
jgi:uncharacterized membrane protein